MEDKKKVLSIKDIAAISGVSIATVSRILNKRGDTLPKRKRRFWLSSTLTATSPIKQGKVCAKRAPILSD